MQARNTLGHFLSKARKSIFLGLSFKQRDDHTCYIIKYSVILQWFTISETKNWNRRMEQKAEELYEDGSCGAHPRPQFSADECGEMVLKQRAETGNVLETIRRFQREFPNRNIQYCWHSCSNLNHTGHAYCNCPFLLVFRVSPDSDTCLSNLNITSFCILYHRYPFIYWKCCLGCAPTIFVQFLLSTPFISSSS